MKVLQTNLFLLARLKNEHGIVGSGGLGGPDGGGEGGDSVITAAKNWAKGGNFRGQVGRQCKNILQRVMRGERWSGGMDTQL